MTEEWRRKNYYRTRVLIDSTRLLDPQFSDSVLCLTGPQLEMIRNLCEYLHRRSTFVAEYHQGYYLTPSEEDFDAIMAIVSDLEETIMGCEEFTDLLTGILAQVSCTCNALSLMSTWGPGAEPLINGLLEEGTLVDYDDNGITVPVDEDRCALAQLVYWQAWELLTETIQPAQDAMFEYILPSAVALLGTLIGGPVLGIPLGSITAWVTQLAKVWKDGSLVDVQNTWYSQREEVTCALYEGLATSYGTATAMAVEVIKAMEGLSPIDQVVFHALCGPWAIMTAQAALTAESEWALANITPGYCIICDITQGNDWFAVAVSGPDYTVHVDHPAGSYWVTGCWQYTIPDGWILQGIIGETTIRTGCNAWKRVDGEVTGCSGTRVWNNQSEPDIQPLGTYFIVNGTSIDEAACKAQLAPGSTSLGGFEVRTGPLAVCGGFQMGYGCTGEGEFQIRYLIFRGSPT